MITEGLSLRKKTAAKITAPIGKLVAYGTNADEVVEGAWGDTKFAGIITAVTGGANIYNELPAEAGVSVTVERGKVFSVKASGTIHYGDELAMGDNGTARAIDADVSRTGEQEGEMIGRAESAASNGDKFNAFLFIK